MSDRIIKRILRDLDCKGTGNYEFLFATSIFFGAFIPLFFILREYGYGSLDASAYSFLASLGILWAFWLVFFVIVPSTRKTTVQEEPLHETGPPPKSYIINMSFLIFGTALTLAALILFTTWHLWGYIVAAPVIFILWHLFVDRFLSGITNRISEKE